MTMQVTAAGCGRHIVICEEVNISNSRDWQKNTGVRASLNNKRALEEYATCPKRIKQLSTSHGFPLMSHPGLASHDFKSAMYEC